MPDPLASYNPRVIVKFKADYVRTHEIPYDPRVEKDPGSYFGQNWANLVAQFQGLTIQRTVTSLTPQQLVSLVKDAKIKAEQHHRIYPRPDNHFLTYFSVRLPPRFDPMEVVEALRSWETVDLAYVEGTVTLPARPKPGTTAEIYDNQTEFLGPAPDGINAKCAWKIPGGDGGDDEGLDLRFADIEQGWNLLHPDLPAGILPIWGTGGGDVDHGTLVLGIVLAVPNGIGCVGITPNVTTVMVASCWPDMTPATDVANAIAFAIRPDDSNLRSGDILLLEAQVQPGQQVKGGYYDGPGPVTMNGWRNDYVVPIEVDETVFEWILNATTRGIIVVEAAGNGGLDLDAYTNEDWYYKAGGLVQLLDRKSSQFRDSFAIMVGAAHSSHPFDKTAKPRSPMTAGQPPQRLHNYGTRIDCYAWGEQIKSTAGNGDYGVLNHTSGAAAIIAGAALAVQGIAQYYKTGDLPNYRFSPDQLRSILRNPATGTVSAMSTWNRSFSSTWDPDPMKNPDFSKWNADKTGVMPNLQQIINDRLGIDCNDVTPPSPPTGLRIS